MIKSHMKNQTKTTQQVAPTPTVSSLASSVKEYVLGSKAFPYPLAPYIKAHEKPIAASCGQFVSLMLIF